MFEGSKAAVRTASVALGSSDVIRAGHLVDEGVDVGEVVQHLETVGVSGVAAGCPLREH